MRLNELSAHEAAARIAQRRAVERGSGARLPRAHRGTRARDQGLRACRGARGAIAAARDADTAVLLKDGPLGPLHGVPVRREGHHRYRGHADRAQFAPVHAARGPRRTPRRSRCCAAPGPILIGKTETIEFAAHGRNPVTRNPHDLTRTPGGSSSGSAAAVADLMVPLTLGTQTGGSVIRPASFCGVFGFKPTWGSISAEGAKLFSVTLDTIGWYARAIDDIALLAKIYEISSAEEPAPAGLNLAYCETPYWDRATADGQAAFRAHARQACARRARR